MDTPQNTAEDAIGSAQARTDASVRAVIEHLEEIGKITPEQGELIFWLHGYGLAKGLTNSELSARSGISKTAISQIFSGKYAADDWDSMIGRISSFRKDSDDIVKHADVGFVETDTAAKIFKICKYARNDSMPAFIYGASQIGKTTALCEFVRRSNNPSIKYMRCRSGMTRSRLARLLAQTCHVKSIDKLTSNELNDKIIGSLFKESLIIIDEFHMLTETVKNDISRQLVEFIREIYDLTGCGIVIAATKVGMEDLEEGPNKMLFEQFRRRGILKMVLPDVPSQKDINSFAKAYGLPYPIGKVFTDIRMLVNHRGLGAFDKILRFTRNQCATKKEPFNWEAFIGYEAGLDSLCNIVNEADKA